MKSLFESIARGTRHIAREGKMARMMHRFHRWTKEDQARLEFYSQLIKPGQLVFDVGANVGNRSKVFTRLGANVVAVEPQCLCAQFLERAFRNQPRFRLIQKALGATTGQAEMLISDSSTLSTLSEEWVQAMKDTNRFASAQWKEKQTVTVDTMDNLIQRLGRPDFVKVDVEGFEEQVVSGLTQTVGMISLEVTPEFLTKTFRCIDRFLEIGSCQFQVSFGESMSFCLPDWVDANEVRIQLLTMKDKDFGDLYVRFN